MKIKYFIYCFKFFIFFSAISQKNDSIDVFLQNKFLFSFIYNRPIYDYYEVIYKPVNAAPHIDKIKSKMILFPEGGFRLNYSLRFYQRKALYHFFRMNIYFHRQYVEFKDTVYVINSQNKYYNEYFAEILNLAFLPEYTFRYKFNQRMCFQGSIGYNYSYTVHSNFELYKLFFPFWLNKNYFINNFQINISVLMKVTKNILIEQGFYWNTNPLWNKYIGFVIGIHL